MNTPAIQQAIRLERHPTEMAWICSSDSVHPEGISDLLRLCSSKEQLFEFAKNNGYDPEFLSTAFYNFVVKAMVNENNSDEKILGTDNIASSQVQKFHYQLLMKIFHPDVNNNPDASHYSAIITKAYQGLKHKELEQDVIRFSEHRKPSKNYYQATQKAESQISTTKTAVAFFSAVSIIALVAMAGKFYDPANPELIAANNVVQDNILVPPKLVKISALNSNLNTDSENKIQASNTQLQALLKKLESAYEKGNVDTIMPLLANAPEIKDQTEEQLHNKLETLFEITAERKMVLFDFNWTPVSGKIQGQGKFLSRYQLVGEKKWLTREGSANVLVESHDSKLKVTQLILANQNVD